MHFIKIMFYTTLNNSSIDFFISRDNKVIETNWFLFVAICLLLFFSKCSTNFINRAFSYLNKSEKLKYKPRGI